jgi:hypothetical protein
VLSGAPVIPKIVSTSSISNAVGAILGMIAFTNAFVIAEVFAVTVVAFGIMKTASQLMGCPLAIATRYADEESNSSAPRIRRSSCRR